MTDSTGLCHVAPLPAFMSMDSTAGPFLREMIRRLVEDYWIYTDAEHSTWDAIKEHEHEPSVTALGDLATHCGVDAERRLALAILSLGGELDPYRTWGVESLRIAAEPRALIYAGRLYAVVQSPDDATPLGEKCEASACPVMRVRVIDLKNVVSLD